jgi:hypothetical protein
MFEPERWSTTLVLHRKGLTRSISCRVPPQFTRKEEPSNESALTSISSSFTTKSSLTKNRRIDRSCSRLCEQRTGEIRFSTAASIIEQSIWPGGMTDARPPQHRCIALLARGCSIQSHNTLKPLPDSNIRGTGHQSN